MRTTLHVTPNAGGDGWTIVLERRGQIGPVFPSFDAAERAAEAVADALIPSEVIRHREDGQIREGPSARTTHPRSSDPRESRG